ncbi:MAG: hypothetical protein WDO73_11800 [Ignavibacteriota bacterium]
MADNGDFGKVAAPLCLASAEPDRENFFHSLYLRAPENCHLTHIPASESAVAGLASLLELRLASPTRFDIRWLGALHALLFLLAYASLLSLLRPLSAIPRFALSLVALWIFADVGLLAYFNSFYTDTTAALGALAAAFLAAHLFTGKRTAGATVLLFGLSALLFVTSKAQHGALAPIPAGFAFLIAWRAPTKPRVRTMARFTGVLLLSAMAWVVLSTPAWYKSQARFDLVFYKLAKGSPTPGRDLAELGLSPDDARYVGLTSYVPGGPMNDAAWVDRFGARCTYGRVALFYLQHPARTLRILWSDLQGQAWQRRIPGLANYTRASGRPEGTMAVSLSSWSELRTWSSRRWPAWIAIWLAVAPIAALRLARGDRPPLCTALAWTLTGVSLMAAGEFGIASLADSVETPRHLLLFHVFSDISIFLVLAYAAVLLECLCPIPWRRPAVGAVAVGLALFVAALARFELAAAAVRTPIAVELPSDAVDGSSPRVLYSGNWTEGPFTNEFRGTLTYCEQSGATASFLFEGMELQYFYTKAPNRGMASVSVDGIHLGDIDLYGPRVEWRMRSIFSGLPAGHHRAEIRVLGRHDPASSGDFVDIDALVGH